MNLLVIYKADSETEHNIKELLNGFDVKLWSPLYKLQRIAIVFGTEAEASRGQSAIASVYPDLTTRLSSYSDKENSNLQVPDRGRLLKISPPPSPPTEWQSRDEEPPNKDAHYDTENLLLEAIKRLEHSQDRLNSKYNFYDSEENQSAFLQQKLKLLEHPTVHITLDRAE
ncbi:hypothetical protein CANCADRAFT_1824 [Tortispora caseinolytica NRRL Y-17796]|uniref:Calcipressin n=1 Tax=Tortispora caseinolytica NRRL Y-17796 TaxID=767744 RepID=A0A1E4TEA1_9ASCO|nr:hypothetical protein CANCADRAFT_1824 [Tortispora caseinolytica NRRL Y-17796]